MTPFKISITAFGITMGLAIPVVIAFIVMAWASNKWFK